ncbi:hypothetical protein RCO48_11270 [Peribacillus frigoritolerans]|nr:hypothetical protein [Peribacillus frigoritolerans]
MLLTLLKAIGESADLLKEIDGLKDMIKSLQIYSPDRKISGETAENA